MISASPFLHFFHFFWPSSFPNFKLYLDFKTFTSSCSYSYSFSILAWFIRTGPPRAPRAWPNSTRHRNRLTQACLKPLYLQDLVTTNFPQQCSQGLRVIVGAFSSTPTTSFPCPQSRRSRCWRPRSLICKIVLAELYFLDPRHYRWC